MRLFYAVNFPFDVKDRLAGIQNALRKQTEHGNFTLRDNLHLTLVFVGETPESKLATLCDITDQLKFDPFDLTLDGVGTFKREGGDIVWMGIRDNSMLQALYRDLAGRVSGAGFRIESRRYTPHLTLAREARFRDGFNLSEFGKSIVPIVMTVEKASLMKSQRQNGRLVYTELR